MHGNQALTCPRCRTGLDPGSGTCPRCGAAGVPAAAGYYPPSYPGPGPAAGAGYGYGYGYGPPGGWQPPVTPWQGPPGFAYPPEGPGSLSSWGKRLCGRLIDGALFLLPGVLVFVTLLAVAPDLDGWFQDAFASADEPEAEVLGDLMAVVLLVLVTSAIMAVLHGVYVIVLTTRRGGTLGHTLLGMEVRHVVTGERVGLGQSAARYFAELGLAAVLGAAALVVPVPVQLLDPLWAAWDDRNQTLHDKAAKTIVVNTR